MVFFPKKEDIEITILLYCMTYGHNSLKCPANYSRPETSSSAVSVNNDLCLKVSVTFHEWMKHGLSIHAYPHPIPKHTSNSWFLTNQFSF